MRCASQGRGSSGASWSDEERERRRASLSGTTRRAPLQLRQLKGSSLATVTVVPTAVDRCLTGGEEARRWSAAHRLESFSRARAASKDGSRRQCSESKSDELPQQVLGSTQVEPVHESERSHTTKSDTQLRL
jgi:hypothetical protein